jgi:hypothetical protein
MRKPAGEGCSFSMWLMGVKCSRRIEVYTARLAYTLLGERRAVAMAAPSALPTGGGVA